MTAVLSNTATSDDVLEKLLGANIPLDVWWILVEGLSRISCGYRCFRCRASLFYHEFHHNTTRSTYIHTYMTCNNLKTERGIYLWKCPGRYFGNFIFFSKIIWMMDRAAVVSLSCLRNGTPGFSTNSYVRKSDALYIYIYIKFMHMVELMIE